ncbi:ABC transporter permease [Candidimonas humi]|uniref:ABC transporter permease n=1 Tax=Candidimonas humi TaxID=683355 RepID=A0ABV8NXG8_9BURK|nr:ABC transporter permease [Candidimonas humi]MBV6305040.1 ABC transporter permease [Candidimonas humi]
MPGNTYTVDSPLGHGEACVDWRPLALLAPLFLFLVVFFLGPLFINFQQSIRAPDGASLTGAYYLKIFSDSYYLVVLLQTVLLGLVVVAVCIIAGYPMAYVVARSRGRARTLLVFVLVAPLLVSVVVRSFGWMVILGSDGMINSMLKFFGLPGIKLMYTWTGITIALVHVLLPFMVLAIASTIETLDSSMEEAAQVLGARRLQVFRYVLLPLSLEGIITGSILTFTLTVGSFVTVMLLGNNATMVLPLLIYQRLTVASDWPTAAALGIVLLLVVVVFLWLQARLHRRTKRERP